VITPVGLVSQNGFPKSFASRPIYCFNVLSKPKHVVSPQIRLMGGKSYAVNLVINPAGTKVYVRSACVLRKTGSKAGD